MFYKASILGRIVVSVSVSSLALYLGALAAARGLHAALLSGVLRAPSIGFFDCTPVGRVLNRFSKDIDVLDNVLPMTLRGWSSCFFAVCAPTSRCPTVSILWV